jgi:hypothetical protein
MLHGSFDYIPSLLSSLQLPVHYERSKTFPGILTSCTHHCIASDMSTVSDSAELETYVILQDYLK